MCLIIYCKQNTICTYTTETKLHAIQTKENLAMRAFNNMEIKFNHLRIPNTNHRIFSHANDSFVQRPPNSSVYFSLMAIQCQKGLTSLWKLKSTNWAELLCNQNQLYIQIENQHTIGGVLSDAFDVNCRRDSHEGVGGDDGQPIADGELDWSRRTFEIEGKELLTGPNIP